MTSVLSGKKYRDESWDFVDANTKQYTHCFHPYPAMMIPQVARKLLEKFGKEAKLLFDPYCGTGTSLVEANLRGINAIGTDINPLARLIARVKTTIIPLDLLNIYLNQFNEFVFQFKMGKYKKDAKIPTFKNIDYWFKKETQYLLSVVKQFIEEIENESVRDFFRVAFSETVRDVSLTRNGEFKLFRMSPKQVENFQPDVFGIMISKLMRNKEGMIEFTRVRKNSAWSTVYGFNTVFGIPEDILASESVDIVITSPPYGDSRTTVAYGQFSRLSNQWLGLEETNEVDRRCMGGVRAKTLESFGLKILDEVIEKIAGIDEDRAKDVVAFYKDYLASINNVSRVVKKGGVVAYVVGNRRVKGIEIPTDEITKQMFKQNGFEHIETIIRRIPHKRMPRRNSPSNVSGKTDVTMNYEYVVVLRKL